MNASIIRILVEENYIKDNWSNLMYYFTELIQYHTEHILNAREIIERLRLYGCTCHWQCHSTTVYVPSNILSSKLGYSTCRILFNISFKPFIRWSIEGKINSIFWTTHSPRNWWPISFDHLMKKKNKKTNSTFIYRQNNRTQIIHSDSSLRKKSFIYFFFF